MSKKIVILLILALSTTTSLVLAETSIQQIQSPIYTDEIGRSHFLGKGGYSSVRHIDMGNSYTNAVNEVANYSDKNKIKDSVETDITNVIKERTDIPVSSKSKASFTTQKRTMDPSASFGNGATYLPSSGVNNSKTIYTDDLGRMHFFGKGNIIRE